MKFKKILVSDDNQLVVGDYGLNESDVEIIDLNKSLHDVADDEELREFILKNIINPDKVYIVCVKENFGSSDQLIEDIENIKQINKIINKSFKKIKNLFFFVYNTYMKNEGAVNPTLDRPSTLSAKDAEVVEKDVEVVEKDVEENKEEATTSETKEESNDFDNVPFEETVVETSSESEDEKVQEETEEVIEFVENDNNLDSNVNDMNDFAEFGEILDDKETAVIESDENTVEEIEAEIAVEEEQPVEENEVIEVASESGEPSDEIAIVEEPIHEEADASSNDIDELNSIVSEFDNIDTTKDDLIRDDIAKATINAQPQEISSDEIFDEKEYGLDEASELGESSVNLDSVDAVAVEGEDDRIVFNNKLDDSVDMPESYFDTENEENISYEDYNEFVNDYELNIHTLKSIYDFIWRILVLNNHNLKLNDLLYIAVNNLDAFSIGQSDFVRQTANKAESLFDLILQLDIKLEFNNSLFYIYLAQFFSINGNNIVVNQQFLDTLAVWVDKASKRKFVEQIEQFMNYSSIYNKKIIFSYFVELANFIKGCLPTIRPNISLIDIHRILNNPSKKVRKENVFGFLVDRVNKIFKENGVVVEMYLVDTPDNVFGVQENTELDPHSESWKTQLTILYKKLVENVLNYILLKGNKEAEIFNMYIDIKDLRMYKNQDSDRNLLSPETVDALAQSNSNYMYATIGDSMQRNNAIVPSQMNYEMDIRNQYLSNLESSNGENNGLVYAHTQEMHQYPDNVVLANNTRSFDGLRSKYASKFNMSEFENAMSRRIEEYEKKIKDNIARIEAERKQLRQKMEDLKNI